MKWWTSLKVPKKKKSSGNILKQHFSLGLKSVVSNTSLTVFQKLKTHVRG